MTELRQNGIVGVAMVMNALMKGVDRKLHDHLSEDFGKFHQMWGVARENEIAEGVQGEKESSSVETKEAMLEVIYDIREKTHAHEKGSAEALGLIDRAKNELIESIEASGELTGGYQTKWQDMLRASRNEIARDDVASENYR